MLIRRRRGLTVAVGEGPALDAHPLDGRAHLDVSISRHDCEALKKSQLKIKIKIKTQEDSRRLKQQLASSSARRKAADTKRTRSERRESRLILAAARGFSTCEGGQAG